MGKLVRVLMAASFLMASSFGVHVYAVGLESELEAKVDNAINADEALIRSIVQKELGGIKQDLQSLELKVEALTQRAEKDVDKEAAKVLQGIRSEEAKIKSAIQTIEAELSKDEQKVQAIVQRVELDAAKAKSAVKEIEQEGAKVEHIIERIPFYEKVAKWILALLLVAVLVV